jgi:hypothetical protein
MEEKFPIRMMDSDIPDRQGVYNKPTWRIVVVVIEPMIEHESPVIVPVVVPRLWLGHGCGAP